MTKEELKQNGNRDPDELLLASDCPNCGQGCNKEFVFDVVDIIREKAYKAGQEAEREFIKKDMFEKVEEWYGRGTSMVADYFENLINTKE